MVDRFQVVPAAYVLLRRTTPAGGEEVLLQFRQNTGYLDEHWAFAAAGHVEANESVLDAAVREAAEELGVHVDPADLVPLTAMHRTHANGRPIDERVDFFFELRTWQGEPRVMEPGKSAGHEWFALTDLPEPVAPHERFVLEHLHANTLAPIITYGF